MDKKTVEFLDNLMIPIQGGKEYLRDYIDDDLWISSDSKMSIPGQKGNLREIKREIILKPFFISKYPLTNTFYKSIIQNSSADFELDDFPVVNVSWNDAVAFCNLLSKKCGLEVCYTFEDDTDNVICDWKANGYRLPTDAEWQYACRAGSAGYRYGEIDDIAWYFENSKGMIHPIGKKKPNNWGLYDMLGNVYEWCWDIYDESRYGSYRVFRGGSWAESARSCGATGRRRGHPSFFIDDLGFRIARSF